MDINKLSSKIIGAAIEVHKTLGPGLLESAYEECLCYEFGLRHMSNERQKSLPVIYKGKELDCGYGTVGPGVLMGMNSLIQYFCNQLIDAFTPRFSSRSNGGVDVR